MKTATVFRLTIFSLLCLSLYSIWSPNEPIARSSIGSVNLDSNRVEDEEKSAGKTPEERARFTEERLQYEFDMLKNPTTGLIPPQAKEMALAQALRAPKLENYTRGAGFTVTPRGPSNFGGRTRAIAIDARFATNNTILAGGVSSGVFRSTDGGSSWAKVSSNNDIHNVTAIAQDPRVGQQNTWYYATGEILGNSASLGSAYRGNGVWKSTDNGNTWNRLLSSNSGALESFDDNADYCFRLVVNPTNGDVYVAVLGEILRSQDGGTTWTSVLGPGTLSGSLYTDIVVSSTGVFYAGFSGNFGATDDGVWTSTTGNAGSWTRIANSASVPGWNTAGNYGRLVLGLAPSNQNILYALYNNFFNSDCGGTPGPEADLFVFDASGPAWTDLSANVPDEAGCLNGNDPFAVQGGYNLTVAVKPDDPNTVFIGGTNLYRSTNGFSSAGATTRIGGYVSAGSYGLYANHHPDIHDLVFAPNNNDVLYSGSDGGIHSADITAGTVAWTSLNNNYVTYQFYHVAMDQTLGSNIVLGGTQDNGTKYSTGGTTHIAWAGGDGVAVGVNAAGTFFWGTQRGPIYRGGAFIRPTGTSSSLFVTYFYLDPDNTEYLYYTDGTDLYRTANASTVTTAVNAGNWVSMTGVNGVTASNIRSLATSRGTGYNATDANRKLYIGTETGQVLRLNDPAFATAAAIPVDITPPTASAGLVSGIAVNPNDDNEILVTYSNYGISSVFHTSNANSATPAWTEVEGSLSLPSFRSASIIPVGGTNYYVVGTSVGLYCTTTLSGATTVWSRIGTTEIGYALCSSLALRPTDFTLLVGSHGNGMFTVSPPTVPLIAFATGSSNSTEGATATLDCRGYTDLSLPLTISEAPVGDATVSITVSGTATPGLDYEVLTPGGVLTFPDGSTASQNYALRIYDDSEPEAVETLLLDIAVSGTTDALESTVNNTHTLSLNDNDLAPTVELLSEDFESPLTFGGFTSADWTAGFFTGGVGTNAWIQGANGGMNGSGSIYVSSNGSTPAYDATVADWTLMKSALVDATGISGLEVSFNFICNGNANDYGLLYYSLNGNNYTLIEGSGAGPYVGITGLTNRTVTLPAVLDNSTFYLAWSWINDNATGNDPPFTIDDVIIRKVADPIETVLNATDAEYLGPFATVYYYDGGELIASIQNLSAYDYGCTSITVDRAGTGATAAWSILPGDELADKTILITPTNNTPGASDQYVLTYYFTDAEFSGWVSGSDPSHTAADFKLVKSPGSISALNPSNQNATVNLLTTYTPYGSSGHAFSGTFDSGFSGFGGGNPPSPVLPVGLLRLEAQQIQAAVQLDWTTSWEQNSERFVVERSQTGETFQPIGTLAAQGASQIPVDYQYVDAQPYFGLNVYRLRQVDQDGKFTYSAHVAATVLPDGSVQIGPNPFAETLRLTLREPGVQNCQLRLYTLEGKLVYDQRWAFTDQLSVAIPLGSLAAGAYLYHLQTATQKQTGKLLKR